MSRAESTPARWRAATLAGLAAGLVVVVVGGIALREHGPGNMGTGFLAGGLLAVAGAALASWRAATRPATASTFERSFTQSGDERDDAVLTHALAVLGICSLPATGVAAVAIALGAGASMVLALLLFGQLAIGAAAFAVANHRH
ncbi:hypothetical protein [Aeromicrobium fastidiosum]|uniref:DUF2178 domain-containing protein n=1 Tax=Aeromicrobium fastidiosum TaxID=52699 RepID=A0A641ALM5_9ACTN|nr:hypothetical protein [Aeromicrobium fastidiosum]KAA1376576.1 hypothetical protein ESP62_014260 [Aeromicrobium fastidiosum]MBP2391499.1 hypothetical protein [Aeromicrobium fastidiosum]